jgi:hypothetical protein
MLDHLHIYDGQDFPANTFPSGEMPFNPALSMLLYRVQTCAEEDIDLQDPFL